MGLVAAALLIAGLAAAAALRGYLYAQVDRNLTAIATDVGAPVGPNPELRPDGPAPARPGPLGPEATYVQVSDAAGAEVQTTADDASLLDPPVLPVLTVQEAAALSGDPFVVDSESGETRWRVVVLALPDGSGSVAAAQDIGAIDATVSRLVLIELAIGIVVLILLGVAGRILIRRSLRPLDGVERAAAAIAAGDLGTRAPATDPRTEIGSLAASFNTMADNVQGAFAAQQTSEVEARASAEQARASEARMRQFIADASHELRTPLTSVLGFAELYRIGAVEPGAPLDDAMGRIEAEAARMGILVDDLLLLARLDQQRPLEQMPVDLVELVNDSVVAARASAPGRDVHVRLEPPIPDGAIVLGDPVRLRQVVDNLLSNALRYSATDRPVSVRVGWWRGDLADADADAGAGAGAGTGAGGGPGTGSTDHVEIEVSDEGDGMSADVSERAFERFYRADRARSREQGGSGLGLAIVAAIVAAHRGAVDLESQEGIGTSVRVRLPLSRAPIGAA
jgi:two-component system OmpR family sensor kinase